MGNLEKYRKDLERLIVDGEKLSLGLYISFLSEAEVQKIEDLEKLTLPKFKKEYQIWYSEALSVIKILLPDRLNDFIRLFEKPNNRKTITFENYTMEDHLQGLVVTRSSGEEVVGPKAAIPLFEQQCNILKSAKRRFESSLFDIKGILQADIFDSELEAAKELNKKGFTRGAGAIAGVVLEHHLSQVCRNHNIKIIKKNPTISDYNDTLKENAVIEIPDWRYIQHLGDLRNLCDHKKSEDPTEIQIKDLILGVDKISKTIF